MSKNNKYKKIESSEDAKVSDYNKFAKKVASFLTKEELIEFDDLLDQDSANEFFHAIREEAVKVAPELFCSLYGEDEEIKDITVQDYNDCS